jgi:SOS-response transcriptional repressor LexA
VALPYWAIQIGKLLKEQRLTQVAFAAKMNVTQVSISLWVSGKSELKPEHYFRMASIWPESSTMPFFLKRAAETSGAVQVKGLSQMLSSMKKPVVGTRRAGKGTFVSEPVQIPLLKDAAAAGTPRQMQEEEIDEILPLPASLCPHPDKIVCFRIAGDSMSPLLEEGYIVAVDTDQHDQARLNAQMVAARDPEGGVTVKWLRRVGRDWMLVPQHTSKRHQPVILTRGGNDEGASWQIVGKVLWWIGMPT